MTEFYDFLGHKLNVGDKCVYLKNVRTGSSTIRKCMFKGIITGFTNCKVKFGDTLAHEGYVVKVDYEE